MALMRRMMLSCEEATYFAAKEILEKVSLKDRMNLHMHLAGCKYCKKYYRQTQMIIKSVRHNSLLPIRSNTPLHRMSPAEKSNLQKLISNKIRSI